jgi:hypothetical protein
MNLEDLGRRAVACKHWRWMEGMLLLPHIDGCECCEDRNFPRRAARIPAVFTTDIDVPDLSDPATLGCLLHLVREAWGDPDLSADRVSRAHDKLPDVWQVYVFHESGVKDVLSGHSEVEALVAALGAAP